MNLKNLAAHAAERVALASRAGKITRARLTEIIASALAAARNETLDEVLQTFPNARHNSYLYDRIKALREQTRDPTTTL